MLATLFLAFFPHVNGQSQDPSAAGILLRAEISVPAGYMPVEGEVPTAQGSTIAESGEGERVPGWVKSEGLRTFHYTPLNPTYTPNGHLGSRPFVFGADGHTVLVTWSNGITLTEKVSVVSDQVVTTGAALTASVKDRVVTVSTLANNPGFSIQGIDTTLIRVCVNGTEVPVVWSAANSGHQAPLVGMLETAVAATDTVAVHVSVRYDWVEEPTLTMVQRWSFLTDTSGLAVSGSVLATNLTAPPVAPQMNRVRRKLVWRIWRTRS